MCNHAVALELIAPDSVSVTMSVPITIVLGLLAITLLLAFGNARWGLPLLGIVNRWLRWITFALIFASGLTLTPLADRHLLILVLVGFLVWFLLETVYNWLMINALSRSEVPLFPKYKVNESQDEWPVNKQSIVLRDWLRSQEFQKVESLKAPITEGVNIRSSIYQNADGSIRCQVLFFPTTTGQVNISFALTTRTTEGEWIITDNAFMPFAAYHPENWFTERRPLTRSLPRLIRYHLKRLQKYGVEIEPWKDEQPLKR